MKKNKLLSLLIICVGICVSVCGCARSAAADIPVQVFDPDAVPEYSGTKVIEINHDVPFFDVQEHTYTGCFYKLSELDDLGRCQSAVSVIGKESYPEEERVEDLSSVTPAGWNQQITEDGEYVWNRGHLLAFAMTGIQDDPRNITALTSETNQKTMLGWEVMVLQACDHGYHVRYRVTPVYKGDELIPRGLLLEAYCLDGQNTAYDATFCVFVYNVMDGVTIDYADGTVALEGGAS